MASPARRCDDFNVRVCRFLDDPMVLRMSATALGVYWRLLLNGWRSLSQPGVYPGDHCALRRLAQASDDEWQQAWPEIKDCFRAVGSDLHQLGQMREWERQTRSVRRSSEAGKAGARKRWSSNKLDSPPISNPNGDRNASFLFPQDSTQESKSKDLSPDGDVGGFETLWKLYPHYGRRSSRAKSLQRWKAVKPKPSLRVVIEGLTACRESDDWIREGGRFVPGLEVWIGKRGWDASEGRSNGEIEDEAEARARRIREEMRKLEDQNGAL